MDVECCGEEQEKISMILAMNSKALSAGHMLVDTAAGQLAIGTDFWPSYIGCLQTHGVCPSPVQLHFAIVPIRAARVGGRSKTCGVYLIPVLLGGTIQAARRACARKLPNGGGDIPWRQP